MPSAAGAFSPPAPSCSTAPSLAPASSGPGAGAGAAPPSPGVLTAAAAASRASRVARAAASRSRSSCSSASTAVFLPAAQLNFWALSARATPAAGEEASRARALPVADKLGLLCDVRLQLLLLAGPLGVQLRPRAGICVTQLLALRCRGRPLLQLRPRSRAGLEACVAA